MNYVTAGIVFAMIHDAVGPQLEDLMIVDTYPEVPGGAPAVYTIMATPKGGQSTHITDPDDGRRFIERMRRRGPDAGPDEPVIDNSRPRDQLFRSKEGGHRLANITITETTVTATWDILTAGFCDSCGQLVQMDDARNAGPLYECDECGHRFNRDNSANNNNQCPNCNKMASRVSDLSCSECGEGDIEEVTAVDRNGELKTLGDLEHALDNF